MLHSVPKMLRTCSRVVGVFGDMFLHSVPKKEVLAFRAEKGGLRRPVLNTESCNTPKKGISWNAHIPGVGAEYAHSRRYPHYLTSELYFEANATFSQRNATTERDLPA